jgi:hypothetical protein
MYGGRPALLVNDTARTFAELAEDVKAIAGWKPGDRVKARTVAEALGAWRLGASIDLGDHVVAPDTEHRWWTPGLTLSAPEGSHMLVALDFGTPEGFAVIVGALAAGATLRLCAPGELGAALFDGVKAVALPAAQAEENAARVAAAGARLLLVVGPGAAETCERMSMAGTAPRAMGAIDAVSPKLVARVWHTALGRLGQGGLPVPISL